MRGTICWLSLAWLPWLGRCRWRLETSHQSLLNDGISKSFLPSLWFYRTVNRSAVSTVRLLLATGFELCYWFPVRLFLRVRFIFEMSANSGHQWLNLFMRSTILCSLFPGSGTRCILRRWNGEPNSETPLFLSSNTWIRFPGKSATVERDIQHGQSSGGPSFLFAAYSCQQPRYRIECPWKYFDWSAWKYEWNRKTKTNTGRLLRGKTSISVYWDLSITFLIDTTSDYLLFKLLHATVPRGQNAKKIRIESSEARASERTLTNSVTVYNCILENAIVFAHPLKANFN